MADGSFDPALIINNLWLVILVLILVIPMMQRRIILTARRKLLQNLVKTRNSQVITLIHRQETISLLGIPLARYIDIEDSEEVLRAIRLTPPAIPIDLILHTPGGLALAATQIALALQAHPGKKTVIIPHYAMSGGTLIALAADEIVMDHHAVLGPVDPQLMDQNAMYPAVSLLKIMELKNVNRIDDRTLVLVDQAKKAMNQMETLIRRLIAGSFPPEETERIIKELLSGNYPHDHPFMAADVKEFLGERVTTQVPLEVFDLMRLYQSETGRRRPGVEYAPGAPRPEKGAG
jgi:ClpP class serine protease